MMTHLVSDRSLRWRHGLHGLGQCDPAAGDICDGTGISPGTMNCPGDPGCPGYGGNGTTTTTTSGGGINWTQILAPLSNAAAQIGKLFAGYQSPIYHLPPGTYYQQTPYGTVVSTAGATNPSASALTSTTLSNLLPIALVVGGAVLLINMSKR